MSFHDWAVLSDLSIGLPDMGGIIWFERRSYDLLINLFDEKVSERSLQAILLSLHGFQPVVENAEFQKSAVMYPSINSGMSVIGSWFFRACENGR